MAFGAGVSTSVGITTMCHWQCHWCHVMPVGSHNQKSYVTSQFERNAVVSLMTPVALCDASTGSSGVTQAKCYVASYLNHLDLRNVIVPLMISDQ